MEKIEVDYCEENDIYSFVTEINDEFIIKIIQ